MKAEEVVTKTIRKRHSVLKDFYRWVFVIESEEAKEKKVRALECLETSLSMVQAKLQEVIKITESKPVAKNLVQELKALETGIHDTVKTIDQIKEDSLVT